MRRALIVGALCLFPTLAFAVRPGEMLADPAAEARARNLSAGLRCMVCQNQSIDDSEADLARDLRVLVRQRVEAGDSDAQIRAFLVARYGDFILLRPPVEARTMLLWGTPVIVLALGGATVFLARRRARPSAPAALRADEEARLAELLADQDGPPDTLPKFHGRDTPA